MRGGSSRPSAISEAGGARPPKVPAGAAGSPAAGTAAADREGGGGSRQGSAQPTQRSRFLDCFRLERRHAARAGCAGHRGRPPCAAGAARCARRPRQHHRQGRAPGRDGAGRDRAGRWLQMLGSAIERAPAGDRAGIGSAGECGQEPCTHPQRRQPRRSPPSTPICPEGSAPSRHVHRGGHDASQAPIRPVRASSSAAAAAHVQERGIRGCAAARLAPLEAGAAGAAPALSALPALSPSAPAEAMRAVPP